MKSAPLGSLVEIKGGGTPRRDLPEYWGGSIPWATVKDFVTTEIDSTQESVTELGVRKSATNIIPAGNIIIPTRMALGKAAINRVDLAINQDLKALIPMDPQTVDRDYLFRFLLSKADFIESLGKSATVKGIRLDVLKDLEVPLPPTEEQKRIAAILDKADAIRRKCRQAIQLADEFMRSVFLDMFGDPVLNPKGWQEAKLYQISEIASGVAKRRKLHGKKTVTVPYMRVANVQDGRIFIDDVQEIEVLESEVEKYRLKQGDILLTEGGDPDKLGRGAVWKGEIAPCIHQNHIFRVRANAKIILPEFLSALVGSQRGKRYFLKAAKQTTGVASINKTQLSGFPALLPPIEIQYEYLRRLEKFDHMVNLQENKYKEIVNLFNSLTQRAFRGEL